MATALTKFGSLCREMRAVRNFTMGDQADALDIDVSLISAIEAGAESPTPDYIDRVARWLDLSPSEMQDAKKRGTAAIIAFPVVKHITSNNKSVRFFRKISKMAPSQIRDFRKQGKGENKDDG